MKSFAVIGMGRFGSSLARELCAQGHEVLAIDCHSDLIQQISADVTHAVVADACDKEVLKSLGIRNFDCAIVGIGGDLTTSVLTAMNLMELGVPYVVAKAHDEMHRRVLDKLGVNRVIIPEQEQAVRLARGLSSHNVLEFIELSDEYSIVEVPVPALWQNASFRELHLRSQHGLNVIAVNSQDKMIVAPDGDFVMKAGDVLIVLGNKKDLKAVQKL